MSKPLVARREARKVTVRPSTKAVHIPIRTGLAPNIQRPHEHLDSCTVRRGPFGWGWHECEHHLIYIEEAA